MSIRHYAYDGLGSVRNLTDENGTVTDAYIFTAFGILLNKIGNTENRFLFTGEQLDPNSGFYYLRSRYYVASTGRFLTMDSFEGSPWEPQSLHKHVYAHNNPVKNIDPSGKMLPIVTVVFIVSIVFVLFSSFFSDVYQNNSEKTFNKYTIQGSVKNYFKEKIANDLNFTLYGPSLPGTLYPTPGDSGKLIVDIPEPPYLTQPTTWKRFGKISKNYITKVEVEWTVFYKNSSNVNNGFTLLIQVKPEDIVPEPYWNFIPEELEPHISVRR